MDSSLKLELLKNKEEHAQSAIASQEVREHLAGFIRSKQLGSSTQVDKIQKSTCSVSNASGATKRQLAGARGARDGQYVDSLLNGNTGGANSTGGAQNDDHPLRKTASMPTMHIPYKAQSLSRRRQMERRTTMSPLMKRKSRPRRQPLHSLDSSSAEYSSNPCIIQANPANVRSLSQSNSPPVQQISSAGQQQEQSMVLDDALVAPRSRPSSPSPLSSIPTNPLAGAASAATSTPGKLHSIFTSMELEMIQRNLKPPPVSSQPMPSSASNHPTDKSSASIAAQHRQQHLKVSEAIRKTVIQRASSKGRIASGGSLDIELSPTTSGANSTGAFRSGPAGNQLGSRDELRQWSLDGADLRSSVALGKPFAAATLFHRDLQKLRLATTSDAASVRRSQSPSSSISMGLSGNQAAASVAQQPQVPLGPQYPAHLSGSRVASMASAVPAKHHSSSSSSTSSLLSQQDSLEDSSSQAIDLSSSSEVSRHHRRQPAAYSQQQQLGGQQLKLNQSSSLDQSSSSQQHYQKMLQESFNQLQLCQTQEGINQLLLSSQPQGQQAQQQPVRVQRAANNPTSLLNASKTATSLDAPAGYSSAPMSSLADQFNLSASAQNLISMHQQQPDQPAMRSVLHNLNSLLGGAAHQHPTPANMSDPSYELNQWLLAYPSVSQPQTAPAPAPTQARVSADQSDRLTSSLITKIAGVPEPYKSALLAQLLHYQTQQLRALADNSLADSPGVLQSCQGQAQTQAQQQAPLAQHNQESSAEQKMLIGRALSSPLLASHSLDASMLSARHQPSSALAPTTPAQHPFQAQFQQQQRQPISIELTPHGLEGSASNRADELRSTSSMLVDGADELAASELCGSGAPSAVKKSRSSYSGAESKRGQLSLDLTLSSRSSEDKSRPGSPAHRCDEPAARETLTFAYRPSEASRGSYSFIYNPIFDKSSSTGLTYELEMCNHKCICANEHNHPENSYRILAIWRRLYDRGLLAKCARVEGRRATLAELQLCHSDTYSNYFGKSPYERIKLSQLDLSKLPIEGLAQLECGGQGADIDTAWNEELTPGVARLAAGCVIEAATNVAKGKLMNAFAVVRPPGHHAEYQQAMGFCFFNSVAIAARVLVERLQLARVLIVDWDVHHGNGIQRHFYHDKTVMYISLHRHDRGNFFPGTGNPCEIGASAGEGYNWNVAWSGEVMGDAEYLAAFRALVMPISRDFNPSMVLVACGFDAARGHPFNFGGYDLSAACFANMTRQLMTLANGRLVLCLEGGYQLGAICDCAEACVRALLNECSPDPLDQICYTQLTREPNQSACETLQELSGLASKYWPSVARWRPTIEMSAVEAANSG